MDILGLDLSHWQGKPDWAKVHAALSKISAAPFAMVKATEGQTYVDPMFHENVKGARGAGVHAGAYHFASFGSVETAKLEAKHFLATIADDDLDYPVVCDLEQNKDGLKPKALTDALIAFLEEVEAAGYFAMYYINATYHDKYLEADRLKAYSLWMALKDEPEAAMLQYDWHGHIDGIAGEVDLDKADYDFAPVIAKMHKKPTPAPKPSPAPKPKPVINTPAGSHYSIVDYLVQHHMPSDFAHRRWLAGKMGIHNYSGTAAQNLELIDKLEHRTHTIHESYVVRSGDTLSEIAASHKTSVAALMKLNPNIKDASKIYVGQKIILK